MWGDQRGNQVRKVPFSNQGFTLIEMLTVVTVISVLAALLLPAFAGAKEKAQSATCMNNLRQIGYATYLYAEDNNEYLPFNDMTIPNVSPGSTYASKLIPYLAGDWQKFWDSYLDQRDFKTFTCPSWKQGEGNAPVYESPRSPNRDYASNYRLCTYNPDWNLTPVKTNFLLNESDNAWVNWLIADGGYRRLINDFNGPILYGAWDIPGYWSWNQFQARHSGGANVLFRDGGVRRV